MNDQEFPVPGMSPGSQDAALASDPPFPQQPQSPPVYQSPYPGAGVYGGATGYAPVAAAEPREKSYFDGGTLQLIGWRLLGFLLTLITLGIGSAWAQCMIYRWQAKHTVIDGRRLVFTGKGLQLFGKWLLWGLLTLITLGIFAIFIPVKQQKWYTSHLRNADTAASEGYRESAGVGAGGIVLIVIAGILAAAIAVGAFLLLRGEATESPQTEHHSHLQMGINAYESGDHAQAISHFYDAIREDSSAPEPYLSLARVYLDMQDLQSALEILYQGKNSCPGYSDIFRQYIGLLTGQQPDPDIDPGIGKYPVPTTTQAQLDSETYYVHVSSGGLNLRSKPDANSDKLTLIPQGTRLEVTAWENGWAQTSYGGYTGWCSGDYLRDYLYTPPAEPDSQGASGGSGQQSKDGYTLAQLEQANRDTQSYASGYYGKTPSMGKTSMSQQGAVDFYREIMDSYLHYNYIGELKLIDVSEWEQAAYHYEQTDLSIDDVCNYYFSRFTDDVAYRYVTRNWVLLDGKVYRRIPGMGDEGLYTEFDFTVEARGDGYYVTMHVRNYRGENNETMIPWDATHRCFQEDGVWVFDGYTSPYV